MDLERRLQEAFVAPDPGVQFTNAVMARVADHARRQQPRSSATSRPQGRNRWRLHVLVFASAVAAGIAAAMWASRLARVPEQPISRAFPAEPAEVAEATTIEAPAGAPPAASRREPAQPGRAPPSPSPSASPSLSTGQEEVSGFTVLVTLSVEQMSDPAARQRVEMFYAAMLQELRKVSGLKLVVPDDASSSEQLSDFVIAMTGMEVEGRPDVVQVRSDIRSIRQQPAVSIVSRSAFGVDGKRGVTVDQEAASVVENLQLQVFPRK